MILIREEDYRKAARPMAMWGELLAPLVRKIADEKPKAIGLDLVLPQFPLVKISPEHDPAILRALAFAAGRTSLVSGYIFLPSGKAREPMPFYRRILGENGYGHFNLNPDSDGMVRTLDTAQEQGRGRVRVSFAALLAGSTPPPGRKVTPDWRNPAVFKTLGFHQALDAPAGIFRGKTVLIGMDLPFMDRHSTPARPQGEAGVVVQARFSRALAKGATLHRPARLFAAALPAVLALAVFGLLGRSSSPRRLTLAAMMALASHLILCVGALALGVALAPLAGVAALAACFLWRLESAQAGIRRVFGRYVSGDVRRMIQAGEMPLDGEVRQAAMLFADLRDFTPLCEREPPKDVVRLVNAYFDRMARVIHQNNGQVLLYAGDEVFACFMGQDTPRDQALNAMRAALQMRSELKAMNDKARREGGIALRHGVGIHCGRVVAGNLGSKDRMTYTLLGDAVNLASRLQTLNKKFHSDILISDRVKNLLPTDTALEELPPVAVKGKERPVTVWRVP